MSRKTLILVAAGALATAATIYWMRDDGETARAAMHAQPAPRSAPREASRTVTGAPGSDTHSAARASPAAGTRPEAAAGIASRKSVSELLANLERALAESDPDRRDLVIAAHLPALMDADPVATARFAELAAEPRLRELLVRQVAQLWAERDPDAAIAWAESLADSPERQAALIDLSLAIARGDPARAVQWREGLVGNEEADGVLEGLVHQWASRDFEAALAWTSGRPRNTQRDHLLQRLVYVQAAGGAPEAAARLAEESFSDQVNKMEAVATIAYQWALVDRDAAARWAGSLEPQLAARAAREIAAVQLVAN